MFLTDEELAELTGIRTGKNKRSREELQRDHLRKVGIPFYPNARGKPMVVASALAGTSQPVQPTPQKQKWMSNALQRG